MDWDYGNQVTLLHWAVAHRQADILKLLLKHKADTSKIGTWGRYEMGTPMDWSLNSRKADMSKYFLEHDIST